MGQKEREGSSGGGGGRRQVVREVPYSPMASQMAFHRMGTRFKGFSGPVGSGKSAALVQEVIRLAYKNAGRRGVVGAPTYKMLRDATVPALLEALDAAGIPYSFLKSENRIELNEIGSEILLRSLSDADRLRGMNLAWFGVDELSYARKAAWEQLEARLRDPLAKVRCGFGVWTPRGHNWVWRKFVEGAEASYGLVQARPFENRYVLDAAPDYYERLKHSYDERMYRQEVLGEYLAAESGLVYFAFERKVNIRAAKIDGGLPLLWSFDFNVDPMTSVIAQRVDDELHVIREAVLQRSGTAEMCRMVMAAYGGHKAGIVIYGDASGRNRKTSGESDYSIIRKELGERVKMRVPRANPAVRDRVAMMNSLLNNAAGEAKLFVDASCEQLVADFEQVHYREGTSLIDKESDKKRTHLSDALGYLVWQEFGERGQAGERGEQLIF
jgi:hypothetical protein